MANPIQKGKITLSDFKPGRIKGVSDIVQRLLLGVLIGRADNTVERKSPDGLQVFVGLSGDFEAIFTANPDGTENAPIASSVLFMDNSFAGPVIKMLSDEVDPTTGQVVREGAVAVQIAYNIYCQRAGNAAGYEWALEPLQDVSAEAKSDPLADMRKYLALPAPVAQIADKGSDKK